jgi:probable sporulation protein (polysaccharide deacetylase family)
VFVFFWRKNRIVLAAVVFLLLAACLYTAAFTSEQVFKGSGKPIYQGDSSKKQVSITVNVDWGEEHLPLMLDILQENRAKATFFVSGRWAEEHPKMVLKIAGLGHEIGNHGFSHPHVNDLDLDNNIKEIEQTRQAINKAARKKTRYFAPPYGEFNDTVLQAASKTKHQVILWTVDTVDWQKPSPAEIVSRVTENAQNGAIILMHPTEQTNNALPEMIKKLRGKGYQIVPLEKLIAG